MTSVAVVGSTGRVGRAVVQHLARSHDVVAVARGGDEPPAVLAVRAVQGARVVVNAAGVAHVEQPTSADLDRLRIANVELPTELAAAALASGAALIHISSIKAVDPDHSAYARSKRDGDDALLRDFGDRFHDAGLPLVIVRPRAMLFPPFDAGKLARLRPIRHVPAWAVPPLPLPVVTAAAFLSHIDHLVSDAASGTLAPGCSVPDPATLPRATLRDVHTAMRIGPGGAPA